VVIYEKRNMIPRQYDPPMDKCPACGENWIGHILTDFRNNNIFKCKGCGLEFINPQYSDADLNRFYDSYITCESAASCNLDDSDTVDTMFYLSRIESILGRKGDLLDFGCGHGAFLKAGKDRGWSPTGYDVDCARTAMVSQRLSVPVLCGDFFKISAELGKGRFDVIIMSQVLEHLKSPIAYLDRLGELLKSDGLLYIALPNIASFSTRTKLAMDKAGLRPKNRKGQYYTSDHHVLNFTKPALKRLVEKRGYEVVELRGCYKDKPYEPRLLRWLKVNTYERFALGSSFYLIARKKTGS
jgi:2-polyprenyl-3-methyl-5-hydroxy-6-metoxy-1,4-benzoquinol methylase